MEFLSINFSLFFTLCFLLYCILNVRFRNILLLGASCVFIGWNYPSFLLTAFLVVAFTFFWAKWIDSRAKKKKTTKIVFNSGILILILSWLFFHYTGAANHIIALLLPGIVEKSSSMNFIVFPLGMSFYTFQAISYLTDVYWQEEEAEHNILDFLLYMLFFMKFLSGPIERSRHFIEQLKHPMPFNYTFASIGIKFIFLGLMKKLLIASVLAPQTQIMFNSIHELSGLQLLMTCLLYPIELYADFSGYTDIAIGGAYMFGLKLVPNFNSPFAACSTTDLWRRWHMSLSFWVRDYIFVPLTANTRRWSWGVYFSLITTFILLGLWHGIGMTFAIYGLIQGIIICWEMKVTFFRTRIPKIVGPYIANALFIVRTYILFALSLLFFRIPSLSDAWYFIRHISFGVHESWKEMNIGISDHFCIVAGSALLLMFVYEYFSKKESLIIKMEILPGWMRWIIYYSLVIALFSFGKFDSGNFIYLQF